MSRYRAPTPEIEVHPCSNVMGSILFVRRGKRQEIIGGTGYNAIVCGWFWFTYGQNTCRVPARNTVGESVRYPDQKACTDAAVAWIKSKMGVDCSTSGT